MIEEPTGDDVRDIERARAAVAAKFIRGRGLEVGAGSRPFPIPVAAQLIYGDIRDTVALREYFRDAAVLATGGYIDAQTYDGVPHASLDFVISAHVVEHLRDPIGSVVNAVRTLKRHGVHVIVVPDIRHTFDRNRPETTVDHALLDYADGGAGTCRQGYEEHLRFVHPFLTGETYPELEIQRQASESEKRWRELDIHFHAWTRAGFEALLSAAASLSDFRIEFAESVANENIFVLRKNAL